MRRFFTLSLLLSVLALHACGTRGALYLPPQQKTPPPAAGSPTPQPDPSTAKDSAS